MNILLINKYLYPKGGDAITTLATGELLRRHGHRVTFWGMDHPLNPAYPHSRDFIAHVDYDAVGGLSGKLKTAGKILYSFEARKKIERLLRAIRPDIVHLHNFAHQISPSVIDVFRAHGIPCVATMHDYKLVCPVYTLLSGGKVCDSCKHGKYYHCVRKNCNKHSRFKSALSTAEMYLHHAILRIYGGIRIFISPSRFLAAKVREMGFKGEIAYLPNAVNLEAVKPQFEWSQESIVYFGRLSEEKGLLTLLDAMRRFPGIKLKLIGDGPLKGTLALKKKEFGLENVELTGYLHGGGLQAEIGKAMFVVLPSEWYENNPRAIIEGFALGKAAVGSKIGGIPELIRDNETGFTFRPGDAGDLERTIRKMINGRSGIIGMGRKARRFAEEELNEQKHYEGLLKIYERAIASKDTEIH